MDEFPEVWVSILVGESSYAVLQKHYAEICVAFDQWVEDNIDSMLKLELVIGEPLSLRTSSIEGVALNTPTGRARHRAWHKHLEQEEEYGG